MRNDYVATGYILRKFFGKIQVLLVRQVKFDVWLAPGGHLGPGEQPHLGALREVKEETGLDCHIVNIYHENFKRIRSVLERGSVPLPIPFCIMYEHIPECWEDTDHMHIDFSYIMVPNSQDFEIIIKDSGVSNAKWVNIELVKTERTLLNVINITEAIGELCSEKLNVI